MQMCKLLGSEEERRRRAYLRLDNRRRSQIRGSQCWAIIRGGLGTPQRMSNVYKSKNMCTEVGVGVELQKVLKIALTQL